MTFWGVLDTPTTVCDPLGRFDFGSQPDTTRPREFPLKMFMFGGCQTHAPRPPAHSTPPPGDAAFFGGKNNLIVVNIGHSPLGVQFLLLGLWKRRGRPPQPRPVRSRTALRTGSGEAPGSRTPPGTFFLDHRGEEGTHPPTNPTHPGGDPCPPPSGPPST